MLDAFRYILNIYSYVIIFNPQSNFNIGMLTYMYRRLSISKFSLSEGVHREVKVANKNIFTVPN